MKVQSTKQVQTCPNIEPREKKKEYQPKCIMQTEANNKKTDENWEKNGEVQVRHNFFIEIPWSGQQKQVLLFSIVWPKAVWV